MNRLASIFALVAVAFFCRQAIAEDVVNQLPAWQTQLQGLLGQATSPLGATVILLIIEATMRLVKTQDPKSLLYVVSNGFKLIAKVLDTVSGFLDQYIQRLKQ